jgi:MFS family permease
MGAIAVMLTAGFLLRAGSVGTGVLIGLYLAGLDPSTVQAGGLLVGLSAAVFYGVELLGAPVVGILGDRLGLRRFLLLAPAFGVLSVLPLAIVTALPLIFLARTLEGLAVACSTPSLLALISFATRDSAARRGRIMGAFEVASVGGIAAGGVAAGLLWAAAGRGAFLAIAAAYLLALAGLLRLRELPPRRPRSRGGARLPAAALRFLPAWVAVNAVVGLWITQAPYVLTGPRVEGQRLAGALDAAGVSLVFTGVGLALGGGILAWGRAVARLGSRRVMVIGLIGLSALGGLLLPLNRTPSAQPWPPALLAVAALAIFVAAAFTPAALVHLAEIAEATPDRRGAVMGLYSVFFGLGQVAGSLLGGLGVQALYADGLIGLSLLFALGATLGMPLIRAAAPVTAPLRPALECGRVAEEPL